MNYIRHLNGFFERLAEDERLSSYHISLYIALFQQWNANRFNDQFTVSRMEMMQLARIGSANTYARCMKELADWGYIDYAPSSNIHLGSKVTCIRFDTASDTTGDTATDTGISCDLKSDTGRNTAGGEIEGAGLKNDTARNTGTDTASDTPFINYSNRNKPEEESSKRNSKGNPENYSEPKFQIPEFEIIRTFFEQNRSSPGEAQKFYTRYQSSGWKTGNMKAIVSWQAVARKWIENNQNNQNNRTDEREHNQNRTGQLSVAVNKNYNEPL